MLKAVKLGWSKLKTLYQAQIDQHVTKTIKRQSKESIREACSNLDNAYDFAAKMFFQLPEFLKSRFNEEAEEAFKQEVSHRLINSMKNDKNFKKVFYK
jgi:hypothetical protein